MKHGIRRISALALVCMFMLTATACNLPALSLGNAASPSPLPLPTATPIAIVKDDHPNVHFSDMVYTRPDTDAIETAIETLQQDISDGIDAQKLLQSYQEIYRSFNDVESAMSLAYLLYSFDVTNDYYEQEYTFLQTELNTLDLRMTDVSVQLFESSAEADQLCKNAFGDAYIETVYEDESLNNEEIVDLQQQELSLVNEYNRVTADFSFRDSDGTSYTADDLYAIKDLDEYFRLYDLYLQEFNKVAGKIFLRMTDVRAEIAETLGYGSYAAYMYDCYGRDYTLQDAQALQQAVKQYIVPLYLTAYGITVSSDGLTASEETKPGLLDTIRAIVSAAQYYAGKKEDNELGDYELNNTSYPMDAFFASLKGAAADFSPNLYASFNYMLENGLYDFSVNPKKMSGSFTTYISRYDSPFIFSQWENQASNIQTVVHELGHFTNYYRNPSVGWSAGDSLDLAEVDSQGLELLMTPYYDRFFEDLAPYAERDLLVSAMFAMISGCMEDEFQQKVYANPDMTLDEINAVYADLAREYGFTTLFSYSGAEWVEISHTFQSPMYYISYAVSMVPALALWKQSQTDPAGAKTAYFSIVDREPYAAFREVIQENGLPEVFTEATILGLADTLSDKID